jgi:tetratricopeptide (TPR) repeat protein
VGADKLVDLVHAFAQLTPTPDVIKQIWPTAEGSMNSFRPGLQSVGTIVTSFGEWRTRLKNLVELFNKHQYDEALKEGEAVRRLYPQYVGDANAYEFLSEIEVSKGNKSNAIALLADYQKFGGENPATLKKLSALQEEMGRAREAAATLDEINNIYPVNDEVLHRHLGELWLKQNNNAGAIREYGSVVALHPLDKAGALFNLAQAYFAARQLDKAEQNVLGALEAAPGFRPAQQLLLQIEDAGPKRPQ